MGRKIDKLKLREFLDSDLNINYNKEIDDEVLNTSNIKVGQDITTDKFARQSKEDFPYNWLAQLGFYFYEGVDNDVDDLKIKIASSIFDNSVYWFEQLKNKEIPVKEFFNIFKSDGFDKLSNKEKNIFLNDSEKIFSLIKDFLISSKDKKIDESDLVDKPKDKGLTKKTKTKELKSSYDKLKDIIDNMSLTKTQQKELITILQEKGKDE